MGKPFKDIIIKGLLGITIPLIILLLINNIYSINEFNQKIYESNMRTAGFIGNTVESELNRVESSFSKIAAGNVDFITLSGRASSLQAYLSSYALHNQLKAVMAAYNSLGGFFIYSVPSNVERDLFTDDYNYKKKQSIRQFVRESVENNTISNSDGWVWAEILGESYIFRFFGGRSNYIVAMMSVDKLITGVEWETDHGAVALMATKDNEVINNKFFLTENQIDLKLSGDDYYISGNQEKYMIISEPIENTSYNLFLVVSGAGYFDSLNWIQISILVLSLIAILAVPILLVWLKNSVVDPVERITCTMNRIKEGDIEARVETNSKIMEFSQLGESFNTMMQEIHDLKIEGYEKQLEAEKAQLMYLQLQIRPHFFLNCLKSLYALAEKREYDRIQKMILAFSNHIRYIFRDNMDFVPLKRELEHIKNYIEIQKISAVLKPRCYFDIDKSLEELQIPPLSIQTFVENSVKHQWDPDKELEIWVKARLIGSEEGDYADITVSDNGKGFREDTLRQINSGVSSVYKSQHVGINNIRQRLKLIYGDGIMMEFFNDDKGSVSEILIPMGNQNEEGRGKDNEYIGG